MTRRLFTVASTVSLVLSIVLGFWLVRDLVEVWRLRPDDPDLRVSSIDVVVVSSIPISLGCLAAFLWKKRLTHPAETGHCVTCGYDLRASADRCPECGSPIPAKS